MKALHIRRACIYIGRLRRGLNRESRAAVHGRENDFIRATCAGYLERYLRKGYPMDEETMTFLAWIMDGEIEHVVDLLAGGLPEKAKSSFEERLAEAQSDPDDLPEVLDSIARKTKPGVLRKTRKKLAEMLGLRLRDLTSGGTARVEQNLELLAEAFSFNQAELKLVTFLFILKAYDEADTYLLDYLKCDRFRSRNLLLNILDVGGPELPAALNRFNQIDVIEHYNDKFELTDWFLNFCQTLEGDSFTGKFYRRIPKSALPMSCHAIEKDKIRHVLKLLKKKSELPKHILLYGPPGTGKTSFAYAVASKINASAYEVAWEDENQSKERRAALTSCLKMTNSGRGSVIIVDEADNILNTIGSWFRRGETQDKGWLNRVMEEPGTRVIWITNSIGMIEESVLRRFSFSLHFKPFHRRQRAQLWQSVLEQNRAGGLLAPVRIEKLARKFKVSAGTIDMAVKTALTASGAAAKGFEKAVELALEAHRDLKTEDGSSREEAGAEGYSLDGLNVEGNIADLMGWLDRFDQKLRSVPEERGNVNLLFHGPPGTGKSALARHIADRLDREIICKRMSDLQSMWVGEGEKNIRRAFEEAEGDETVLVIDEADSVFFDRDRARHSWEISFTNEFLTRMEHFRGILICTTNRKDDLDQACLRRFNRKIRFDYLTCRGVLIFYERMLTHLVASPLGAGEEADLKRLTNLAPGDFKNVRDRFALQPAAELSHKILVQTLAEESMIKEGKNKRRLIGF